MENEELLKEVRAKAQEWLSETYDEKTRNEVQKLLDDKDTTELIDSFYKSLEFGTGGLRGIMGVGTNRMNIYTAGSATQGLSNYLKQNFAELPEIKVAIGYDCRNNSRLFAESSAIFAQLLNFRLPSANWVVRVGLFLRLRTIQKNTMVIKHTGMTVRK